VKATHVPRVTHHTRHAFGFLANHPMHTFVLEARWLYSFIALQHNDVVSVWVSADIGIYQFVEQIIADIMTEHAGKFSTQPTVTEVLNAMNTRKSLTQRVKLRARDGVMVDVTETVDHNMRLMNLGFREIYENRLFTGQNTDVLLLAGGVAKIAAPYLSIKHNRQAFVAKDRRDMWMANSTGALLALLEELQVEGL